MSPNKPVDLDALARVAEYLTPDEAHHDNCALLQSAIAELRELRELVGCAFGFNVGRCVVSRRADRWEVYYPIPRTSDHDTLPEALEAARKWEAENA